MSSWKVLLYEKTKKAKSPRTDLKTCLLESNQFSGGAILGLVNLSIGALSDLRRSRVNYVETNTAEKLFRDESHTFTEVYI